MDAESSSIFLRENLIVLIARYKQYSMIGAEMFKYSIASIVIIWLFSKCCIEGYSFVYYIPRNLFYSSTYIFLYSFSEKSKSSALSDSS